LRHQCPPVPPGPARDNSVCIHFIALRLSPTCLIIPCYNEATRLPVDAFAGFVARQPDRHLCFVNDGSTDNTLLILNDLQQKHPNRITVIDLLHNQGKAGAVRAGMLQMSGQPFDFLGYFDADLATPLAAADDLRQHLLDHPDRVMVLGSRIQFLGTAIQRQTFRHYAGRVIATLISLILKLPVYDTQCGAKLFRRGMVPVLFGEPFLSPWLFDVELLARLIRQVGRADITRWVAEQPLRQWTEMSDSRIKPSYYLKLWWELYRIHRAYR
jgi:dolichyl-phosphate beta-glucosyltransferase